MWNGNTNGGSGPPQNQHPQQGQQQGPPPQQQQQQQGPPQQQQWSPQPPNGAYTPRPQQIPPISQAPMQTLQPQHPDQYRALPAPPQMYAPAYPQPPPGYGPPQPAPRQRTAIACRYCRRRKIRCSGFDQADDGRCTNCVRFSQECIFTPVSSQTQAFVPAHTVYRGQNPPQNIQVYGAYGQPIPANGNRDGYQQPPPNGQYPPPPPGYQQPPMYGQPPPMPGTSNEAGRKRPNDEEHTPTAAPPNPAAPADGQPRYYSDPSGIMPPGASPNFYPPSQPSYYHYPSAYPHTHPAYAQPQADGVMPQAFYPLEVARTSSSPHNLGQSGVPPRSHVSGVPSTAAATSVPSAPQQSAQIQNLVVPTQKQEQQPRGALKLDGRTSTDTSMVQALTRRPMM